MTDLKSFVIDFYSTYSNGTPVTNVITAPQLPSSNDIQAMVQELITFLQTNGITLANYGLVSGALSNIINAVKKIPTISDNIKSTIDSFLNNSTNSSSLISSLQSLLTELEAKGINITYVTPNMETGTGISSSLVGNLRSRRPHGQSSIVKFKGLGTIVSEMQANNINMSTNYTNFINKVKSAVNYLANSSKTTTTAATTTATTNTTGTTSTTTTTNNAATINPLNIFNTAGPSTTGQPNNIINNIVKNIVGNYTFGGRVKPNANNLTNTSITDLSNFKAPSPTTNPTETSTVVESTDYYEVSSAIQGELIVVTYSYFPANSQTSSFSCTFSLLPSSLISLSLSAYSSSTNCANEIKTTLCQNAGYATSATPTNTDMWTTYLIWLFSYLGTGVASQLGFGNIVPFPGPTTGAVNYMLNENYLDKVGNFGLTIQTSTMNSDAAGLTSISIPDSWSVFMYNFGKNRKGGSTNKYMATSIASTIKAQTQVTTS